MRCHLFRIENILGKLMFFCEYSQIFSNPGVLKCLGIFLIDDFLGTISIFDR